MVSPAESNARQAERQVDRTAAQLESNIDQAAEQTQAAIGAVGERMEGLIDEAPRQTASVVQSVRAPCRPHTEPSNALHRLAGARWRHTATLQHYAVHDLKHCHYAMQGPVILCQLQKVFADI